MENLSKFHTGGQNSGKLRCRLSSILGLHCNAIENLLVDEVKKLRYYRRQLKKSPLQVLGPYVFPNFRYSSKRCAQIYRAQYGAAMLVYNFGTPIWRLGNGVNIWNLLWSSKRLIVCTEYTNIYINLSLMLLLPKWPKHTEIIIYFLSNMIISLCPPP